MIDQSKYRCGCCLLDLSNDIESVEPNQVACCPQCRAYYLVAQAPEDQFHDQIMKIVYNAASRAGIATENLQLVIRYDVTDADDLQMVSFWDRTAVLLTAEIAAILKLDENRVRTLLKDGLIESRILGEGGWGAPRWAVQKYRIFRGAGSFGERTPL